MIYVDFVDSDNFPIFNRPMKWYFEVIFTVNREKLEYSNEESWNE